MNTTQLFVSALIGIVIALLHEGIAEGFLLGEYAWPAKLSPWASLVIAFGGAFAAAMKADPSATWSYDGIQGLFSIGTVLSGGAALRSLHFKSRKKANGGTPGQAVTSNGTTEPPKAV